MECKTQFLLVGILLIVGFEVTSQSALISSFTCQQDVLKKYPPKQTNVHVQGTGQRDLILFDADIKGVHKGNKVAQKDCYINSGSYQITDANLENIGLANSGFVVYKNSANDFRFRLDGQTPGQDVAYHVTIWGKKDGKSTKEVKPFATCCDV